MGSVALQSQLPTHSFLWRMLSKGRHLGFKRKGLLAFRGLWLYRASSLLTSSSGGR